MITITTREKILKESLRLFSEKGYSDVFVSDIAKAVGIKAPSLYKHFKNKQEIFSDILEMLKNEYAEQTSTMSINGNDNTADADIYAEMSEEVLIQTGQGLFLYFLHDENVRLFRKMLTLEQFKNSELSKLYTKQYFDDPLMYQTGLMAMLTEKGVLKSENPQIMTLHFYSPIYMLLTMCDREPSRENEAMKMLTEHIKQFNQLYKMEGQQ